MSQGPSEGARVGRRGWRGGQYSGSRGGGRGWGGSWWRGRGRGTRGSYSGYGRGRGKSGGAAGDNTAVTRSSTSDGRASSSSHTPRLIQTTLTDCPYPAWSMYCPDEVFSEGSTAAAKIKAFENYFKTHLVEYNLEDIEHRGSLAVDNATLLADRDLLEAILELGEDITNHPGSTLNYMALALHTVLCSTIQSQAESGDVATAAEGYGTPDSSLRSAPSLHIDLPRLYIRLYNHEPIIPLKSLKAPQYGKCVSIQGTVVRVGNIKPLVTKVVFKCSLCHGIQVVALPDGKYTLPTKCPSEECRGKIFTPLRNHPLTQTIDWQTIRVQEIAGDGQREAGRIPRTIECELTADLVDSCVPGDMVTITAIVKATGSEEGHGRNAKDKCMFLLYLHAISVSSGKGSGDASHCLHMEFSMKDYYAIQEIQGDKNVFKLIVGSLCPAIYGHEMVKAGLVLGLFGGSQKYMDNVNNIPIRGDPHILVVGDPGLGKSQMLQAAANLAPRGVYVCGNTTTASGLTVTLSKEAGSGGDYALEAGALVLADQGCCCIDEFDKMGSQHQALLEAMVTVHLDHSKEQQSVSIAKAGIVCSLPARTSILAAANPIGGHYNKAKTVSENLKMNSALLSRFDLVFILLDKPDEEMDSLLSEHVMALHSGPQSSMRKATARRTKQGTIETSISDQSVLLLCGDEDERSLLERLKIRRGEEIDPVPSRLLRKYIGYARKYVHPHLSIEAADVLQKFYLELRKHRQSPDSTPITTRQLESLIRLTEARARLELREVATEQDAKDVVEVMKFSMYDTYSDELGMVDFQRSQHGSGMSQRSQAKRFISELSRMADHSASSIFSVQQLKDLTKRLGLQLRSFEDFIYSLNNQNYLLKKGPKTYQLQTATL